MLSLLIQHIVIKVLSFSTLSHQYPVLDQQIKVRIHSFNTQTSCFSNPSVRPYLHWIQCTTCPTTYRDCLGIFATLLCQCQILTLWPNLVSSANLFNVEMREVSPSRSLIKIMNANGPNTDPWDTYLLNPLRPWWDIRPLEQFRPLGYPWQNFAPLWEGFI